MARRDNSQMPNVVAMIYKLQRKEKCKFDFCDSLFLNQNESMLMEILWVEARRFLEMNSVLRNVFISAWCIKENWRWTIQSLIIRKSAMSSWQGARTVRQKVSPPGHNVIILIGWSCLIMFKLVMLLTRTYYVQDVWGSCLPSLHTLSVLGLPKHKDCKWESIHFLSEETKCGLRTIISQSV